MARLLLLFFDYVLGGMMYNTVVNAAVRNSSVMGTRRMISAIFGLVSDCDAVGVD